MKGKYSVAPPYATSFFGKVSHCMTMAYLPSLRTFHTLLFPPQYSSATAVKRVEVSRLCRGEEESARYCALPWLGGRQNHPIIPS